MAKRNKELVFDVEDKRKHLIENYNKSNREKLKRKQKQKLKQKIEKRQMR